MKNEVPLHLLMVQSDDAIKELQRQRMLLQIEYYTEKEAFRRQTELTGLQRLVHRGDAWFPLHVGKSYYNSLNQLTVEVTRPEEDSDNDHNFEYGRPVTFFRTTPALKYFSFTGTVSYVDGNRMVVAVPDGTQLSDLQTNNEQLGIQLSFDETSYRLMFDALDRVIAAKNNRLAELRDFIYQQGKREPRKQEPRHQVTQTPHISLPWLNPTQEKAVNEVLRTKDVAIVHGPPGTGKTTTLVEAIFETLRRENQVLVCAQSNMAVDWIAEQLTDRGINVLRIGNPSRVNDKMLSFTYERRFEAHPDYPQLWSIRKTIRELRSKRKRGSESWHQKMDRLRSRATELEVRIHTELFDEARVIACTLTGAANKLMDGQKFHTLFIDEAAQALEAACWIAIRRASRIILAGDHCQLPPTVKSLAALKAGLDKTLMERLAGNHPEVVTLLEVQYRMNEEIMRFSSDWFYQGKVKSAPQVRNRSILDFDIPMEWRSLSLDIPSEDKLGEARKGQSLINEQEAEETLSILQRYFEKIGKTRILEERIDVGIISPYRAQVQYLRSLIKRREFFKPYRKFITVNTVDGFQGQERDVVIISLVRSNNDGQIGFLRDLRRMNVAITRARMKLIIIGDASTMTRHPFYRKLWEYIQALQNL